MARIIWGAPGARTYQQGLDRGVLFPYNNDGVPWNGLVSVTVNVSGGELESYYYDGVKYLDVILYEDFLATLEAYDYPPEFRAADGSRQLATGLFVDGQPREPFSLAYRTQESNDLGTDVSYKLHLLYNCMASPSERAYKTKSADVEAPTRSWSISTKPPKAASYGGETYRPTAHFILESSAISPSRLEVFENRLYGNDIGPTFAELPPQQEILTFLNTGFWT